LQPILPRVPPINILPWRGLSHHGSFVRIAEAAPRCYSETGDRAKSSPRSEGLAETLLPSMSTKRALFRI